MSDGQTTAQYLRFAIYWLCVMEGYNAFWQGVAYKEDQTSADLTEAIAWRHGWRSAAWNAQQHGVEAPCVSAEGAAWAMEGGK